MDTKKLNWEQNPLSDKIIENGEQSFKLWLEFEDTSPWDDLKNSFANISVDMMDGRGYGINVWTFDFLKTEVKEKIDKEKKCDYIIPPDLFVETLTRPCIEQTIIDLLNVGSLEKMLNHSVFGLDWLPPYEYALDLEAETIEALIRELKLELPEGDFLANESYELEARRMDNDDIVLELEDGRIVVIHLTWSSKQEQTGFPHRRIYRNEIEFWEKEMQHEISAYKN
ncbi:MAG: hypothetical protein AB8F95_05855 [Bacteroidia bacterium]